MHAVPIHPQNLGRLGQRPARTDHQDRQSLEMRGEPRAGLRPRHLHLQHPVLGTLAARHRTHQLRLVPQRVQVPPAPLQLVMQSSRPPAPRAHRRRPRRPVDPDAHPRCFRRTTHFRHFPRLAKPQEAGVMGVYAVIPNVSHPSPLAAFRPQTHTKSGRTPISVIAPAP